MKLTDKIVNTFGGDKLLHLLVAGWVTQIGTLINWWAALLIAIAVIGLNFVKEKYWDNVFDIKDLIAAGVGSFIAFVIQFIV